MSTHEMELGNMIFGNSRGEVPIPHGVSWEGPWQEFCDELKIGWYGYPSDGCAIPETKWSSEWGGVDTDVFRVMSYDWNAECTCGIEAKMEEWNAANHHSESCYQSELRRRKLETGRWVPHEYGYLDYVGDGYAMDANGEVAEPLCRERGLTFPSGCAVHCDCGRDLRADEYWDKMGGHSETCRLVQPNFLYKPTGFSINWYKYPFRDSYMTPGISAKEWRKIVRHCIESASP